MKVRKRLTGIAIMLSIVMLLAACGTNGQSGTYPQSAANGKNPSEVMVLSVGDEELYLNEVNYYALSFVSSMGITEDTDLDEAYSQDYPTLDDAIKAQFLLTLRQTYILYQKALEAGVTLTDDELSEVDTQVQNYMDATTQDTMDKYGIDKDMLTKVFTIYQMVQKLETQIVQDMEVEDIAYGSYYNFVFLTIEIDEDGNASLDDDGNYIYLSEEEQESQKVLAEEVRTRLVAGEDAEDLIEEYDLSSTSGIVHATTDSLQETYNLGDGETSELSNTDFGYVFVQITSLNDEEYSENVKNYNIAANSQDYIDETESAWFDEFTIEDEDIVDSVWDAFTFKDFQ